jgi:hypothetical protein
MNIPPQVWGPFFWHTIHITALGYPSQPTYTHKKAAKEFFEGLSILIPCPICREHYAEHLKQFPLTPHLDSRNDLFKWTVVLHNAVNKTLNKPEFSEQDVIKYYKRLGARASTPVINHTHFEEIDYRSLTQGVGIGVAGCAVVAGVLFLLNK